MSDTLLATTITEVAQRIGERLPAAYSMDASDVLVTGDAESHVMPEGAPAVRWALGEDDGFLVVALTADAADLLRQGPPEASLGEALSIIVADMALPLAALFDGIPPMIGAPEEVDASEALTLGPGDAVSVKLDDGGVHRATVGLRLVVSDALLAPAPEADAEGVGSTAPLADEAEVSWDELPHDGADSDAAGHPLTPQEAVVQAAQAGLGVRGVPGGAPGIVGSRSPGPRRGPAAAPSRQTPMGDAHPADFASFDQLSSLPGRPHGMSLLGDVEMGVTAELGRAELTVRDVLGLTPGSIIELDRAAGSPVDVVVNGTLIARGEVVVIDEEFGIRITEILGMTDVANPFPMAQ